MIKISGLITPHMIVDKIDIVTNTPWMGNGQIGNNEEFSL